MSTVLDTEQAADVRSGNAYESLIARLRMRISPTFKFLFATFQPTFTEESFTVVPES